MAENTAIGWTHWPDSQGATQNFWMGCAKKSTGCQLCYMYREMRRYGRNPAVVVRTADDTFYQPLKARQPNTYFTCSWSDFNNPEADAWRAEAWDVIRRTPWHRYLILTKLPERFGLCLPDDWGAGWPHVLLGASTENQHWANIRVPQLLKYPSAAGHFVSAGPMLGPINYRQIPLRGGTRLDALTGAIHDGATGAELRRRPDRRLTWLITEGESPGEGNLAPRPADLDWFRAVRDQRLAVTGVAFQHKQHGGRTRVNGIWGGRDLDGRTWDEFPAAPALAPFPELRQKALL